MYSQSKCTWAPLCSQFTSLFNTQVLHYSVQLALNSPERIQSWTAVNWVQRVPESVCVAYKLHILFTVKEEQVYVPSGIRDALECIKRSHGLEEVVALRNLCKWHNSERSVVFSGLLQSLQPGGRCVPQSEGQGEHRPLQCAFSLYWSFGFGFSFAVIAVAVAVVVARRSLASFLAGWSLRAARLRPCFRLAC